MEDVYQAIKVNSVENCADRIASVSESDFESFVQDAANNSGICVSIFDSSLNLLAEEHAGGQCVVHNISRKTVSLFYQTTKDCNGERFKSYLPADEIEKMLKKNEQYLNPFDYWYPFWSGHVQKNAGNQTAYDCVLLSRIVQSKSGEEYYVLLSTAIIPVDATVDTIRFELNLIIAILILVSVLMAYILSRVISRPLIRLNRASKALPSGEFDGSGVSGYREVDELSVTLKEAADEIGKVDMLRKELIANVSHDLRTPLTLITGYSEVMRDIPGENTPENLQIIIDETNRLSSLVTDLLDLSKLEANMEYLKKEPIELISMIRSILNRYEKMTQLRGYSFQLQSDLKEVWVFADSIKLNQVIYNLINNAVHFSGSDRLVLVRVLVRNDLATIEVEDHGEGIPEEEIPYIWDRYYKVDRNHRQSAIGSGLGLSIVKKILEFHCAQYGVRSQRGEGACFWFTLSLLKESDKK